MRAQSRILDQLSLAHEQGRIDDAWARIRTWEPRREGILSPSPLTGLGYPRAARGDAGLRKILRVAARRGRTSLSLVQATSASESPWFSTSRKRSSTRSRADS